MAEQPAAALADDVRRQIMSVAVPTIVSILYRKGLRNTMMFTPKPLNPAATKFVGTAFTVRTIPTREDLVEATSRGERPNLQAEATARASAGDVLVVAMEGEARTAFMGDIMATHFLAKGVAGVVLDGGVSDAAALARIPFPVFCCGAAGTPVTSHRMVVELQAAIGCAGVAVFPGDIVFGDPNGVVCIPRHLAAEVAETAAERERMEEWIIERVREGRPLKGTYPPDEKTLAEYRAWQAAKAGSGVR
jgi:regulator of RNase E activity RraA